MSPALYWSWAQILVGHRKHCPGEVGSKDFERMENSNLGRSNSQAMSPVHLPPSLPLSAVSEIRSFLFVSIYFPHFELFSSHEHSSSFLLTHVLTFAMISHMFSSPYFTSLSPFTHWGQGYLGPVITC